MNNDSLLAKQAWMLLNNPDSRVRRILKFKYFPQHYFLDSSLDYAEASLT